MKLNNWMSQLDDGRELFSLNLAGTHDSVTKYVQLSHFAKCQNLTIYDQLSLGIRVLDIRVKSDGEKLVLIHGVAKVFCSANHFSRQMELSDVLSQCYKFLEENSSETVIFLFKNDDGSEMEKCFDNLYNTYITGNEDKWYLENRSPLLSEARGRLVLIRRCKMAERGEYTEKNTGIDFSRWVEQGDEETKPLPLCTEGEQAMNFIVQDRYSFKPRPRWEQVILPFLDSMSEFDGKYIINYLSTAGGIKGPKENAKYINSKFLRYPLKKDIYYGIIYIDFPTEEIVKKIIETN